MDRNLIYDFWNCGDDQIIQFALQRAHLNKHERETITLILDECMTQEQCAEYMNYSTRRIQEFWRSATNKLLAIPWVMSYATSLGNSSL